MPQCCHLCERMSLAQRACCLYVDALHEGVYLKPSTSFQGHTSILLMRHGLGQRQQLSLLFLSVLWCPPLECCYGRFDTHATLKEQAVAHQTLEAETVPATTLRSSYMFLIAVILNAF